MRKINVGTNEYTEIYAMDEKEFNANHEYIVSAVNSTNYYAKVSFQKGPVKENGANGCHNEDLISIVIDRLQSFQNGEFSCRENAIAITKLEEALMWLNKRTADRKARGVEGLNIK